MERKEVSLLHSLWEKIKKQIKKTGNTEGRDADDDQNPPPTLPPYRYRARQHHLATQEKQHRAAEQSYWQEQLRLAKELNVLTGTLNYITGWATGIAVLTVSVGLLGLIGLYFTFDEARKANKIAWAALASSERPWVGVISVKLNPLQVGQDITVTVLVRNFGNTPSLETTVRARVSEPFLSEQRGQAIEKAIAEFDESSVASKGVLFPDQIIRRVENSRMYPMDQKGIEDFYAEKGQILVIVRIRYRDRFRTPHHTQYCGVYNPKNNGFDTTEKCNEAD